MCVGGASEPPRAPSGRYPVVNPSFWGLQR
jgi:hypothetical protein